MPKPSTKESGRARPKNAAAIEVVNDCLQMMRELLAQVADLKQEGHPYRDAIRTRAELQVRECARRVFGDRSPEAVQWKAYHVRSTSPKEVAESITQLHNLVAQFERKKLELLGLAPPAPEKSETPAPTPPVAEPPVPVSPVAVSPIPAAPPPSVAPVPVVPVSVLPQPAAPTVAPSPETPNLLVTSQIEMPQAQASAPQSSPSPALPRTVTGPSTPIAPEPREQVRESAIQAEASVAAPRPLHPVPATPAGAPAPSPVSVSLPSTPSTPPAPAPADPPIAAAPKPQTGDPLEFVRKSCTRFHSVARQLRLRREYRPTLDVEDERDVQDLLYALLRYELDEVSAHEWVPQYQQPIPSVALVLPRHRLAVVAKKTKTGCGPRELTQQLAIDGQEFSPSAGYQTIVYFIYDPDGRIGNPRGLEADLTKVSDTQVIEVIIAPK